MPSSGGKKLSKKDIPNGGPVIIHPLSSVAVARWAQFLRKSGGCSAREALKPLLHNDQGSHFVFKLDASIVWEEVISTRRCCLAPVGLRHVWIDFITVGLFGIASIGRSSIGRLRPPSLLLDCVLQVLVAGHVKKNVGVLPNISSITSRRESQNSRTM